jgi:hypothetical protein
VIDPAHDETPEDPGTEMLATAKSSLKNDEADDPSLD